MFGIKRKKKLSSKEKFERKVNEENEFEELKRANEKFMKFLGKMNSKKVTLSLSQLEEISTSQMLFIEPLVEARYVPNPLVLALDKNNKVKVGLSELDNYHFFELNENSMWKLYDKFNRAQRENFLMILDMYSEKYLDRW